MAHADYDCCAICDTKLSYNAWGAKSKGEICGSCLTSLHKNDVWVRDVEELEEWMLNNPDKIIPVFDSIGFSQCCYGNPIDDLYNEAKSEVFDCP